MIWILLLLAMPAMAVNCGNGCEEHAGVCACDAVSEKAPDVKPSDEKPPRNPQPEWETGEVSASTQSSLSAQDARADQERREADEAGKKAAGL